MTGREFTYPLTPILKLPDQDICRGLALRKSDCQSVGVFFDNTEIKSVNKCGIADAYSNVSLRSAVIWDWRPDLFD